MITLQRFEISLLKEDNKDEYAVQLYDTNERIQYTVGCIKFDRMLSLYNDLKTGARVIIAKEGEKDV